MTLRNISGYINKGLTTLCVLSCFLQGALSLFSLPLIFGDSPYVIFLPITTIVLAFAIFFPLSTGSHALRLHLWQVLGIFVLLLFTIFTFIGSAVNNLETHTGFTSSLVLLLSVVCCIFITSYSEYNLIDAYLKGFLASCVITSLWMILDIVLFYSVNGVPLNEIVFARYAGSITHTFSNFVYWVVPFPLYRPTGIGWDGGSIVPGLALGLIYARYDRRLGYIRSILFIAIVISFVRTAYLILDDLFHVFGVKETIFDKSGKIHISTCDINVFLLFGACPIL